MRLSDSFFIKIPHFFIKKHLTFTSKNAALRALVNKKGRYGATVSFLIGGRFYVTYYVAVMPTTKTLLLKISANITLIQTLYLKAPGISLTVFGTLIFPTLIKI